MISVSRLVRQKVAALVHVPFLETLVTLATLVSCNATEQCNS